MFSSGIAVVVEEDPSKPEALSAPWCEPSEEEPLMVLEDDESCGRIQEGIKRCGKGRSTVEALRVRGIDRGRAKKGFYTFLQLGIMAYGAFAVVTLAISVAKPLKKGHGFFQSVRTPLMSTSEHFNSWTTVPYYQVKTGGSCRISETSLCA